MPRSKDALALFEIIRKDDVGKAAVDRVAEGDAERAPEPIVMEQPTPVMHRPAPQAPASAGRLDGGSGLAEKSIGLVNSAISGILGKSSGSRLSIWEVAEGRLILSLTPRLVAVGLFAIGVLVALGYWTGKSVGHGQGERKGYEQGRRFAEAGVLDDIEEAKAQQPASGLFEDVGESPVVGLPAENRPTPAAPADGKSNWVAGYTYVVAQDFQRDELTEAKRAGEYLLDNDIETAIVERGEWISLVSLQGFNGDDPVQKKLADDMLQRIRAAGERYFKAGGRVRMQGYPVKLKKANW